MVTIPGTHNACVDSCSREHVRTSAVAIPQHSPGNPMHNTDTILTLIIHFNTVQTGLQDRSLCVSFHELKPGMNGQGYTMFSGSVRSSRRRALRRVKLVASPLTAPSVVALYQELRESKNQLQTIQEQFSIVANITGQTRPLQSSTSWSNPNVKFQDGIGPRFDPHVSCCFAAKCVSKVCLPRTKLGIDVKGWRGGCDFGRVKSLQFRIR
jgi:hypothetical protein